MKKKRSIIFFEIKISNKKIIISILALSIAKITGALNTIKIKQTYPILFSNLKKSIIV